MTAKPDFKDFQLRQLLHQSLDFKALEPLCPKTVECRTSNIERPESFRGFTLIEMITVMAIIFLLVGLGMGGRIYALRKETDSRIKGEIKTMEMALEAYKADNEGYPPLDAAAFNNMATNFPTVSGTTFVQSDSTRNGWANSAFLYRALSGLNTNGIRTGKSYMHFPSIMKANYTIYNTNLPETVTFQIVVDPLGNPYGYNPKTPVGCPQTFDLFSEGINKISTYPSDLTSTNSTYGNWMR